MGDRRLVALAGLVLGYLWAVAHAPQHNRHRLQAERTVKQAADLSGHPCQSPPLVVVPGGHRALVQNGRQPLRLSVGKQPAAARRPLGRQRIGSARLPSAMPLIAGLGGDLQCRSYLNRAEPLNEHRRRLTAHLLAADPCGLADPAAIGVSHP